MNIIKQIFTIVCTLVILSFVWGKVAHAIYVRTDERESKEWDRLTKEWADEWKKGNIAHDEILERIEQSFHSWVERNLWNKIAHAIFLKEYEREAREKGEFYIPPDQLYLMESMHYLQQLDSHQEYPNHN